MKHKTGLHWLWLSAIIIVGDQLTKFFASKHLTFARPKAILPFFNLTLLHNKGAAFSFLSQQPGWQGWLFSGIALVVSIVIVFWLHRLPRQKVWLSVALALILGGALGNFIDRAVHGYVVDFLDFHLAGVHWPAFNVADAAIFVGAVMLLLDVVRDARS